MATLIVSNVGYFHMFSFEECRRYYIVAPVFKGAIVPIRLQWALTPASVLQTTVSQVILGLR